MSSCQFRLSFGRRGIQLFNLRWGRETFYGFTTAAGEAPLPLAFFPFESDAGAVVFGERCVGATGVALSGKLPL